MDERAIAGWLVRRRRSELWLSLAAAVIALALGVAVVLCSFWFGYVLVYLGERAVDAAVHLVVGQRAQLSHEGRLIGAGLFTLLLFVGNARTSRDELEDLPRGRYNVPPVLTWHAGLVGGLLVLLAHPGASSRLLATIFFSGPRLITGAWTLLANARRAAHLDVAACAAVLLNLLQRGHAIGYDEFAAVELQDAVAQLRGLDGVVFLEKGVTLTMDLRGELARLRSPSA